MIFNKNKMALGVDGSRSGFIVQRAVTRLPFTFYCRLVHCKIQLGCHNAKSPKFRRRHRVSWEDIVIDDLSKTNPDSAIKMNISISESGKPDRTLLFCMIHTINK